MNWRALRRFLPARAYAGPGRVAEVPPTCPGEYQALHVYLQARYAGRVVLTFSEIEDLVGFPLPPRARIDATWWSPANARAGESRHTAAWTLANRVAAANLLSKRVVFERHE